MTDKNINDLKESLKLCSTDTCEGCIYYYGISYPECTRQLCRTAWDVIDALQARIKRYKTKVARLKGEIADAASTDA